MWPSQQKPALFTQACILKNEIWNILCMLQDNIHKDCMGPEISEESFNQQKKTIYHFTHLGMKSSKNVLRFSSPNGKCVTWICSQCIRWKKLLPFLRQNHCHTRMHYCIIFMTYLISQTLVNISSQIPTLHVDKCKPIKCKSLWFIFYMIFVQINFLTGTAVWCYTTSLIQLKFIINHSLNTVDNAENKSDSHANNTEMFIHTLTIQRHGVPSIWTLRMEEKDTKAWW